VADVRQSTGAPVSGDFSSSTGTPVVVNGATGDGYVQKTDGTAVKIGAGNADTVTTNANLTGPVTSVGNATTLAIIDAKGDLIVGTAADTTVRVAVGANDTILTADSAQAAGVKWAAVATQAEMEAASSTSVSVTPGRVQYHPGVAKAVVKFNGTGTVAILSSYNVSSITDNGVGDYTVNFTTAFSSVNYSWALACGDENASAFRCGVGPTAAPTASAFRFITVDGALVPTDFIHVSAIFFGDQ
jgi:hypothetical protein